MDWDLESAPLADLTWQTEVEESNLNVPVQRPMHGVWCDAEKKAESGSTFRKARGLDVHAGDKHIRFQSAVIKLDAASNSDGMLGANRWTSSNFKSMHVAYIPAEAPSR